MTSTNYAAAAMSDLRDHADRLMTAGMPVSASASMTLSVAIEKSQHFMLPDEGKLFDDGLRGLSDCNLKLPFPYITVEYLVKNKARHAQFEIVEAERRVAVAFHINRAEVEEMTGNSIPSYLGESPIMFMCLAYFESAKRWTPLPFAGVLPNRFDDRAVFQVVPIFKEVVDQIVGRVGENTAIEMARYDCSDEGWALLELLEALTCKNVEIQTSRPAKGSAKRQRKGKAPLFEMKTLVLKVPGAAYQGGVCSGSHRSPRQHLRRGHIRRLETGNIWVNSCVVGNKANGVIQKNYKIAA